MQELSVAESIKRVNIIDMALTFTAMMRVFSVGSKARITSKLEQVFSNLKEIHTKADYQRLHAEFCQWFTREITTAKKKLRNGKTKASRPTSYGQAAKVLDICSKVYVYYCNQPSPEIAEELCPFLNGAIDTPIMTNLAACFPYQVGAKTIEGVNEAIYKKLQELVAEDTAKNFKGNILPVQYDDIMWAKLNR